MEENTNDEPMESTHGRTVSMFHPEIFLMSLSR